MLIEAIKSPIITAGDDIITTITAALERTKMNEGDTFVVASKVLAITQKRVRKIRNHKDFMRLVSDEADVIIGKRKVTLTLKDNIFIPWAGIDRSNVPKRFAVLWPQNPYEEAEKLLSFIKKKFQLKKAGVIIADSFCAPLRKGTTAIALGYAGFHGIHDFRGRKDLYKKKLRFTSQAVADNLSAAANIVMGEAAERRPFAIIRNAPLVFTDKKINPDSLYMEKAKCLYAPLYEKKDI